MRYIDFEEKIKEMGYGCEMVYDDYLGIPIKLQVRFGQGWFLLPKREGLNILG